MSEIVSLHLALSVQEQRGEERKVIQSLKTRDLANSWSVFGKQQVTSGEIPQGAQVTKRKDGQSSRYEARSLQDVKKQKGHTAVRSPQETGSGRTAAIHSLSVMPEQENQGPDVFRESRRPSEVGQDRNDPTQVHHP